MSYKTSLLSIILVSIFFFSSCGGDEEVTEASPEGAAANEVAPEVEKVEQEVIEEEEVVEEEEEIPDPNGVYLPVDKEEKNGKPVYTNGNGFFLWYNGVLSGKLLIKSVEESR